MNVHSKLPHTGTNIFSVMSALAREYNAINLGQGFPDFPMNPALIELVAKAMRDGENQYAPMHGHAGLRMQISAKIERLYQFKPDSTTEITITPGATYAIYTALTAILSAGDEVIVFEPCYDSYIPNIEVNGAKAVTVPLNENDFSIDWSLVEAAITPKTKAIVLNSPHNPTGKVLLEEDILALQKIVAKHPVFLVSDEVYEHLVFDGLKHLSLLQYPDLMERSFVCFSFGKTYNCTGWKLGYCVAPETLMNEFRKIHQYNAFTCHTPSQAALADFLSEPMHYLEQSKMMQEKRDYLLDCMKGSRFRFLPSYGSFFICADYSAISKEKDLDFTERLTKEAGVTLIPLSSFYRNPSQQNHFVRFCFAKENQTLKEAADRLLSFESGVKTAL
jgi:methionine aminotransferase